VRLYRAALHLYPRAFRREYGEDMVALIAQQLRDENVARVMARTAVDLAITVPSRHLEKHMHRSSTTALVVAFIVLGIVLGVVGGPGGLAALVVLFALAAVTFQRSRPVAAPSDRWWKLLLGGAVLLGGLATVTTATGELGDGWWLAAMVGFVTSFALIAAGLVLGIAARFGTRTA